MYKSLALFSLLAAVSVANAQSGDQAAAPLQPAPVVRNFPSSHSALRQYRRPDSQIVESQPVAGVWLRSESTGAITTVSATPKLTEVRLDRGRLNVSVHHPADHAEILVDLPGGQVSLFKDGLYTFNAQTNTVRVLRGEAAAYPGALSSIANEKAIKIKEDHQLSLVAAADGTKSSEIKPVEAYSYEIAADLLPANNEDYGYGDHGEGYARYGNPYYAGAFGYPYAYAGYYPGYYPGYYGYGYPFGYGIGLGYYGGFGGGFGYRGGFRR